MAQWTGTGSWVSSYVGTLTAVESSYSVENNSSEVTVSLLLENNAYNRFVSFKVTGSISSDGTVVQSASFTGTMQPNSSAQYHSLDVISSYTFTVPHNADGTKTISLSATITTATGYGSDGNKIGAGTINITGGTLTLTNIPRASTISAPNIQIGSSGTLTITKAVSSHVNTVTWSCATLSGTIATKSSSTSISFTPPTTLYAKLPNSTSADITYTVTTYTSSSATTSIGSNTATAKVTVGSSIKPSAPSITLSPVNTNTWLNTKGYYVSGYTKLKIAATATAGSGATLSPLSASVAGQTGTFNSGSNYTTANAISAAGTVTATVTASDSRGRSTSNTASVTYVSYTAPSVTALTAERGTYSGGTWTTSPSGAHIRVTYTVALSLSGNSIKTGSIACTGQTSQSISATSGTVYFTGTNTSTAYTITISVTDQVGITVTKTASVSTISVPFNFNNNLPAMGLGKLAESANLVDSAWNMRVKHSTELSRFQAVNDFATVDLQVSAAGNSGIWSPTYQHWLIYDGTDGHTRIADHVKATVSSGSSAYTLPAESGKMLYLSYNGAITVTIPTDLPEGYECFITTGYTNARLTIATTSGEYLAVWGNASLTTVTIPYAFPLIHLIKRTATRWTMSESFRPYYTAGDTLTIDDVKMGSGFVTTSQTEIGVHFQTSMPIYGATGATLNTFACNCRSSLGGYVQYNDGTTRTALSSGTGDWVANNLYDSVSFVIYKSGVFASFKCTNKYYLNNALITNNSLVNIQFGTLSLTLT